MAQFYKPASNYASLFREDISQNRGALVISILFTIIIIAIVLGLLFWALSYLPVPQPFLNIIKVAIILIFIIWLLYLLLPLAGVHPLLR